MERLGLGEALPISALHGNGIIELLDRLTLKFNELGFKPIVHNFSSHSIHYMLCNISFILLIVFVLLSQIKVMIMMKKYKISGSLLWANQMWVNRVF